MKFFILPMFVWLKQNLMQNKNFFHRIFLQRKWYDEIYVQYQKWWIKFLKWLIKVLIEFEMKYWSLIEIKQFQ